MGKLSDVCGTRVVLAGAGVAAGFGGAGCAVGSGIAVVAIAAIGFAGGRGGCSGLFRRGRGGFLGRGGLFLGLPAYGEGRQTMDGHDQLAILKGGLQQFGIAVVLQVGDKEVVVVCLLGLDVVGRSKATSRPSCGKFSLVTSSPIVPSSFLILSVTS